MNELSKDDLEIISFALLCYYRHMNMDLQRQYRVADLFERVEKELAVRDTTEIIDEASDVDWYALSNGIPTVMPDGTLVNND